MSNLLKIGGNGIWIQAVSSKFYAVFHQLYFKNFNQDSKRKACLLSRQIFENQSLE